MILLKYFSDPLHQASMIGTLLMCFASSLIGVLAYVCRKSLLGETLSHAAFPGAIIGVIISQFVTELLSTYVLIISAFVFSLIGMTCVSIMQKRLKISEDAALCFILATFVGLGVFIASILQTMEPIWFRRVQGFFYGQAATMMRVHLLAYFLLSCCILAFVILYFVQIKILTFDDSFSRSMGFPVKRLNGILIVFFALAVVIGIRAVGVVLMSGMLIAPAVAARAWTSKLSWMFIIAACFGMLSALVGNILSYEIPKLMEGALSLPTGPLILLTSVIFTFFSLILAPRRGYVYRSIRKQKFRRRCLEENFIKGFWKIGLSHSITWSEIQSHIGLKPYQIYFMLLRLKRKGEIIETQKGWKLTKQGQKRSTHIVRLHRLFELYLSSKLNVKGLQIHDIAEEMEHLITPQIEEELTKELANPKQDPHAQPIPRRP